LYNVAARNFLLLCNAGENTREFKGTGHLWMRTAGGAFSSDKGFTPCALRRATKCNHECGTDEEPCLC
jgi:hypothetical protein